MRFLLSLALLAPPSAALADLPVAAVATLPAAPAPPRAADPSESTVFVQHDSAGGTGTVIACEGGRSLVLTCAHVVEHAGGVITVTTRAGVRHAATYLGGSAVRHLAPDLIDVLGPDLCVLSVDAELPAVAVADDQPAAGEFVQLWGFGGQPFGAPAAHKTGRWGRAPGGLVLPQASYTIATISGDSGAGVMNGAGELVAVHCGPSRGMPLATIRGWLRDRVAKWFPRLAARLAARSAARASARELPRAAPVESPAKPDPAPAAASDYWEWAPLWDGRQWRPRWVPKAAG